MLFRDVQVYPGYGDHLLPAQDVTVEGAVIAKIAAHDPAARGATGTIEGRGRTLMPGLIDAHWHAAFTSVSPQVAMTADPYYLLLVAGQQAKATLHRGFTTVRDCGGPTFGLKRAIDEGIVEGPRIYPAGAMLTQTGGQPRSHRRRREPQGHHEGRRHRERHAGDLGEASLSDGWER